MGRIRIPKAGASCCRFAKLFEGADWGSEATQNRFVDLAVAAMRVVNFAVAAILVESDPSVYR